MFTAFGDQGVGRSAAAIDRLLLKAAPAFHLHAGDICYADGTGKGEKTYETGGLPPGTQVFPDLASMVDAFLKTAPAASA